MADYNHIYLTIGMASFSIFAISLAVKYSDYMSEKRYNQLLKKLKNVPFSDPDLEGLSRSVKEWGENLDKELELRSRIRRGIEDRLERISFNDAGLGI